LYGFLCAQQQCGTVCQQLFLMTRFLQGRGKQAAEAAPVRARARANVLVRQKSQISLRF
jgi:hypothetical protein